MKYNPTNNFAINGGFNAYYYKRHHQGFDIPNTDEVIKVCDNKFGENPTCEIEFTDSDVIDDVCYESVDEMIDKENKIPVNPIKRFDMFNIDPLSNNNLLL